MVKRNKRCSKDGLRETPITKAPKTVPIPAPAPPTEMVAAPAPINFAACTIISREKINKKEKIRKCQL